MNKKLISLIGGLSLIGGCSAGASRYVPKDSELVKIEPEYKFVETQQIGGVNVRYFKGEKGSMYIYQIHNRELGEDEVNIVEFNKKGDMIVNGVHKGNVKDYSPRFKINIRREGYSYPELNGGKK